VQYRSILAGIQVTPAAFRLVIVEGARFPAFRTSPLQSVLMPEVNMHLSGLQFQLNALHAPRLSNPQNLPIQISILHLPIISLRPLRCRMTVFISETKVKSEAFIQERS
jgi:hypothetical protein